MVLLLIHVGDEDLSDLETGDDGLPNGPKKDPYQYHSTDRRTDEEAQSLGDKEEKDREGSNKVSTAILYCMVIK